MNKAKVGDIWVSEGNDGEIKYHTVTDVIEPENPCDDLIITLDGGTTAHLGWWYGQGFEELEE